MRNGLKKKELYILDKGTTRYDLNYQILSPSNSVNITSLSIVVTSLKRGENSLSAEVIPATKYEILIKKKLTSSS